MTSGRCPSTACTSPATKVLTADRQCPSRHCRNHSIRRLPPLALLPGASLAASAVRRSSPTCTPTAPLKKGFSQGRKELFPSASGCGQAVGKQAVRRLQPLASLPGASLAASQAQQAHLHMSSAWSNG